MKEIRAWHGDDRIGKNSRDGRDSVMEEKNGMRKNTNWKR